VKLLKEREEAWDTLTPKKIRKLSVEGHAGVYELQEGIFLMCDDYVEQAAGAGVSLSSCLVTMEADDSSREHINLILSD